MQRNAHSIRIGKKTNDINIIRRQPRSGPCRQGLTLIPAWGHWSMVGAGPDGDRGADIKSNIVYDPTNGTVSDGDIVRCQRYPGNRYNPDAP